MTDRNAAPDAPHTASTAPRALLIACGALAHEVVTVVRGAGWDHMTIQCLPAELHNRPERIPGAVREKIHAARDEFDRIFVAYADCGTGGLLDEVLKEEGVERIPGVHCYEFYAGAKAFAELADAEPGTFYLTDFLARHFERVIIRGLGIDRHPELESMYFGNYRKMVYLAQTENESLMAAAKSAADRLGLTFEHRHTGLGDLRTAIVDFDAGLRKVS